MKLLIVEDNISLAEDIQAFLRESGFVAEHVDNLYNAQIKSFIYKYEVSGLLVRNVQFSF